MTISHRFAPHLCLAVQSPVRHTRPRGRTWARAFAAIALIGIAHAVDYRGVAPLPGTAWFTVQHVTVRGHHRVSPGDVADLVRELTGKNILLLDLRHWRRRVLAWPWVADATLTCRLPSTVEIDLFERSPMAVVRLDPDAFLIDATGAIVDQVSADGPAPRLPVVDGLFRPDASGEGGDTARRHLLGRLWASMHDRPDVAALVARIDLRDVADLRVTLDGDGTELRLGTEDFVKRIETYVRLRDTLAAQVADMAYVDLRVDGRLSVGSHQAPSVARRGEES